VSKHLSRSSTSPPLPSVSCSREAAAGVPLPPRCCLTAPPPSPLADPLAESADDDKGDAGDYVHIRIQQVSSPALEGPPLILTHRAALTTAAPRLPRCAPLLQRNGRKSLTTVQVGSH
jgi:hypothetical protein